MSGDSIESARQAVRDVLAGLGPSDRFSLQRFGTTLVTVMGASDVKAQTLRYLRPLIGDMQADLGGTEMEQALGSTLALPLQTSDGQAADVLLITDGAVWQTQEVIEAARRSGQRVFVIGVGSCVAEHALRELAQQTGGACECVTPGEAMAQAVQRMLKRVRQGAPLQAKVDWGVQPAWTVPLAPHLFAGDTVLAFAGFAQAPKLMQVRLVNTGGDDQPKELARLEAEAPCPGETLARLAAAHRTRCASTVEATSLALRYQLVGPHTHAVLVHARAAAEKAAQEALMHRVPSMLAAGHGGTGTVFPIAAQAKLGSIADLGASRLFAMRREAPRGFGGMSLDPVDHLSADFETEPLADKPRAPFCWDTLVQAARAIGAHLAQGGSVMTLPALPPVSSLPLEVWGACLSMLDELPDLGTEWVVFAHWVNTRDGGLAGGELARHLADAVARIAPQSADRAKQGLEQRLGALIAKAGIPSDAASLGTFAPVLSAGSGDQSSS